MKLQHAVRGSVRFAVQDLILPWFRYEAVGPATYVNRAVIIILPISSFCFWRVASHLPERRSRRLRMAWRRRGPIADSLLRRRNPRAASMSRVS